MSENKEDRAARFKRIAERRVKAAVKMIRLVGNCSGAGYYYTPGQADALRTILQRAVDTSMDRFHKEKMEELTIDL